MQKNNFKRDKTKPDFDNINSTADKIVTFLQDCLLLFREKYLGNKNNEWFLNQELEILLQCKSREKSYPFIFKGEYMDKSIDKNTKVDIAIIYTETYETTAFFTIEAKRLRYPKKETKHYVCGDTGGIERFKRELHGKDLSQSAMIGYVEEGKFDDWLVIINYLIKKLCESNKKDSIQWSESDLLKPLNVNVHLAQYSSEHFRISSTPIFLTHLWVKMY